MKKLVAFSGGLLLQLPLSATPLSGSLPGINAVSSNQAINTQSASGVVNQSPVGGVNSNYQINNSQSTDYGFAPGIFCRGANFSVGGYGSGVNTNLYNYGSTSNNFGAIALITLPLGGAIQENCKALAKEIVKQRQLDTAYNLIKICGALRKEGIKLDYEVFPDFKVCEAVNIANLSNVPGVNRDPFTPKPDASVVVPVR